MGTKLAAVKTNASKIFTRLYKEYEDTAEVGMTRTRLYELAEDVGVPEADVDDAFEFLSKKGYVEDLTSEMFELSDGGIAAAEDAMKQGAPRSFADILEDLRAAASTLPSGARDDVLRHADIIELAVARTRIYK